MTFDKEQYDLGGIHKIQPSDVITADYARRLAEGIKCSDALVARNMISVGQPAPIPLRGIWYHYKDHESERPYAVISCGINRTDGKTMIVSYVPLYDSADAPRIHYRNLNEWWKLPIGSDLARFRFDRELNVSDVFQVLQVLGLPIPGMKHEYL